MRYQIVVEVEASNVLEAWSKLPYAPLKLNRREMEHAYEGGVRKFEICEEGGIVRVFAELEATDD